jgi:taurine dioxygenase
VPVASRLRPKAGPRIADRLPEGWIDRPYERFSVVALSPTIGAIIDGVSLADPIDAALHAELNRALLEWKVIFFRRQRITREQHAAFARLWGPLERHPFVKLHVPQPDDAPEVLRLEKNDVVPGVENVWHSDVSWRAEPSLGSVLRAVELPPVGGDTLWADMGAAYDLLSPRLRERIDGLMAIHDWIDTFGRGMDDATREALRPDFPPMQHPVVRTHPETGRRTLYVNGAFTQSIVGLEPEESDALLARLYAQAMYPEVQCRFRWEPGDVAFWDNRATQHYASSDYFPQRRVMERITIVGDRPR